MASVYRAYDVAGDLLYVGMSTSAAQRLGAHEHHSGWWHEVATVTVRHLPTEAAARIHETHAIHSEAPKYNMMGTDRFPRRARKSHDLMVVSLTISRDEHDFIKALAEQQHRSISGQIRSMIAETRESLRSAAA